MTLSFLELPWLVLDNILQHADHSAYLPLCLICKALHHPAKMMLYRYSAYTKKKVTEASRVTGIKEFNWEKILQQKFFEQDTWGYTQNVRYYSATDSKQLNHLLQWIVLHLRSLILEADPSDW